MTLVPTAMAATMLGFALDDGLFDKPPNFALSRTYSVLATGVIETAITPLVGALTTVYYSGQPFAPPGVGGTATIQGVTGMNHGGFRDATMAQSLFVGPLAFPFFDGLAGMIDYFMAQVTLLDLFAPIGSDGTGTLVSGGIVFDAALCLKNIQKAAQSAKIMVVDVDIHLNGDPNATIPDPVTQIPLHKGDFFSQALLLATAVSTQFAVQCAAAAQATIPVTGAFLPPPVPPIENVPTETTVLL
jgi:hypothetical protein